MELTQRDEALIEWFFREHGTFQRSTSGPMFDRAARLTTDSEGKRVGKYEPNWHWRPSGEDQTLEVHDDGHGEAGYMPRIDRFAEFGRMSRILQEVCRQSMLLYGVLEAYYGERGNRWREAASDRFDVHGKIERRGYGPGAIASVFICTQKGLAFLDVEGRRLEEASGEHRTHDDVLQVVLAAQSVNPRERVQNRLDKIQDEADQLLLEARKAYLRAVVKVDGKPPRPQPRPPAKVRVSRGDDLVEGR